MALRFIFGSALLGAMMISQSASALSCVAPDMIRSLEQAKSSPKLYHILVGNFTPLEPTTQREPNGPPVYDFISKPPRTIQTVFDGYSLGSNRRQDVPLSRFNVNMEVSCTGPWCGSVPPPNQTLIAFVEVPEGGAPILKISPCPGQTFKSDKDKVRKLRQCLDKTCQSELPF